MTSTSVATVVVGVIAQAAAATTAVTLDFNTIILAGIGLVGTIVTSVVALRIKEIHTAVNSSKTALENKLDAFAKQNVELAQKVATLEESKRGAELAKAVASAPPGMVVLPAAVSPVSPAVVQAPAPGPAPATAPSPTRMGDAIIELKEAAEETSVAADKTVDIVDKHTDKL